MSRALLDYDLDFAAKLLVSLFNLKRIVFEPRVEAAANVKHRHVPFGQGGEIIERLRFRQSTVHARILRVDAGDLSGFSTAHAYTSPAPPPAPSIAGFFEKPWPVRYSYAVFQSFTTKLTLRGQ